MTAVLVERCAWPVERLGEALERAAGHGRFGARTGVLPAAPRSDADESPEALEVWLDVGAAALDAEAQRLDAGHDEAAELVRAAAPGLIRLPGDGPARFLVVTRAGRTHATLLTPEPRPVRVGVEEVRKALCAGLEAPLLERVDATVRRAGIGERSREKARRAILEAHLRGARVGGVWRLRAPAHAGMLRRLRESRGLRHARTAVLAHALHTALWIVSWWLIGRGALSGRLDMGWLIGWALLLLTMTPLGMLTAWSQGLFFIGTGAALKRRLMHGALSTDLDIARRQGAGRALSRVIESESVERLALAGGFMSVLAVVDLAMSFVVLSLGAGGIGMAGLLVLWTAMAVALCVAYYFRMSRWTTARLSMTQDLVERMVGHRTRLAQERPERWHEEEDRDLHAYTDASRAMDRMTAWAFALIPYGWMAAAMLALIPVYAGGDATAGRFAVALGGALLAMQAMARLAGGLSQISAAWIAWKNVRELYAAGGRELEACDLRAATAPPALGADAPAVIDAQEVAFRHAGRDAPSLRGVALRLGRTERALLEGASGSGKSTLLEVLAGLRRAQSGLLLAGGLDRATLGFDAWRRRIALAPQFHENHILSGSLAFNLLMGRRWPAGDKEVAEAEQVCIELGLGPLLERMPMRLHQMVGDGGWRLSHGERSRVFIARSLLQGAECVALDESFASLDAQSLTQCLRCVSDRAKTLLVAAHP